MEHVKHRTLAGSFCGLRVFTNLGKYCYLLPSSGKPHTTPQEQVLAVSSDSMKYILVERVLHWAIFRIPLFPKSLGRVTCCHYHRDCDPSTR